MAKKNTVSAWSVVALVVGMFCLAYAGFPLYNLFCKVTGYGGTTSVAAKAPQIPGQKMYRIRFNADIAPDLPWVFRPLEPEVIVKSGVQKVIYYEAKNTSSSVTTGTATYNATPDEAGTYFNKIACFCFQKQTLEPGETVKMPVTFFIDPAIEKDEDAKDIRTITLSYTFFSAVK